MRLCSRLVPRSIVGAPVAFVSCVSSTLFQPARSGSHLYSANRNTLRSRTLSSRSYPTLVGLATPLLPCFPHLHPYYNTRMGICQEVSNIFFKSFGRPQLRSHILSPLDTLIISQVLRLVKGFFNFFWGRWGIRTPTLTFSPHLGDTHYLLARID